VGPDTVTIQKLTLGLRGSHATGSLIYILASGDILTSLKADALSLSDIRGIRSGAARQWWRPSGSYGGGSEPRRRASIIVTNAARDRRDRTSEWNARTNAR
jgi:hypothetical protein